MVIPFGALVVAHLVDHRLESVAQCLWLLSFIEDESTELSIDGLALGDLGHLVPLMRRLEDVQISLAFSTLAPYYTPLNTRRRGV
jgi:hypothetical protein